MKTILLITKTNWSEPPRLRHQVAKLLIDKGFKVLFIEKNTYKSIFLKQRKEDNIHFFSHSEFIHHQLRYLPVIQSINNYIEIKYLKKIEKTQPFDLIINFCYDYHFLKNLFPEKKVVTIINDDFEEQAKFGMKAQIKNQLKKTSKNSDTVLTVSYPLYDKLSSYNSNVKLFLPWSGQKYKKPTESKDRRNVVLYFGFVSRLNWTVVHDLIKENRYKFRFVGPTVRKSDKMKIIELTKFKNFEYISFASLNELDVSDVFCSILPYNTNIKSVQACTVSNRAFNLLSLGIPLVYSNLTNIIEAPKSIIRTNCSLEDYNVTFNYFHENFHKIQNDIEMFLENHYQETRWSILEELILS